MAIPDALTLDKLKDSLAAMTEAMNGVRGGFDRLNYVLATPTLMANPAFADKITTDTYTMKVIVSDHLPEVHEYDWSDCRSPSRAKRRHAKGIPQRVKLVKKEYAYVIDAGKFRNYAERYLFDEFYGVAGKY